MPKKNVIVIIGISNILLMIIGEFNTNHKNSRGIGNYISLKAKFLQNGLNQMRYSYAI